MKNKIAICLSVLALISVETFSQVQVSLGIKGGPNFANVDVNQSVANNYKNRTGFHGGAFFLFKATKIGFQPEVLFSKQGSKYTVNTQDLESNFDYINIPLVLKLYLVAGLNLQAGPQFGFLTGGQIESVVNSVVTSKNAKDLYNGADVSIAMGAGWDLPFGLSVDARYNLGVKENSSDDATAPNFKNQVFQVSAGFKLFKFGK